MQWKVHEIYNSSALKTEMETTVNWLELIKCSYSLDTTCTFNLKNDMSAHFLLLQND